MFPCSYFFAFIHIGNVRPLRGISKQGNILLRKHAVRQIHHSILIIVVRWYRWKCNYPPDTVLLTLTVISWRPIKEGSWSTAQVRSGRNIFHSKYSQSTRLTSSLSFVQSGFVSISTHVVMYTIAIIAKVYCIILVTPCLLPRIREFIHTQHRNTSRDQRPGVVLRC